MKRKCTLKNFMKKTRLIIRKHANYCASKRTRLFEKIPTEFISWLISCKPMPRPTEITDRLRQTNALSLL
jgi:hypothetical protein